MARFSHDQCDWCSRLGFVDLKEFRSAGVAQENLDYHSGGHYRLGINSRHQHHLAGPDCEHPQSVSKNHQHSLRCQATPVWTERNVGLQKKLQRQSTKSFIMSSNKRLGSLRKRLSGRRNQEDDDASPERGRKELSDEPASPKGRSLSSSRSKNESESPSRRRRSISLSRRGRSADGEEAPASPEKSGRGRTNIIQRLRERSRSRSRSRTRKKEERREMLVAVTSCRSDGYYNQKAPGSTAKLPRKAPTNLKLFHELAVGVKDAYAAVGATPKRPSEDEAEKLGREEYEGRLVLAEFISNIDFVSYGMALIYIGVFYHEDECSLYHYDSFSYWRLWMRSLLIQ